MPSLTWQVAAPPSGVTAGFDGDCRLRTAGKGPRSLWRSRGATRRTKHFEVSRGQETLQEAAAWFAEFTQETAESVLYTCQECGRDYDPAAAAAHGVPTADCFCTRSCERA